MDTKNIQIPDQIPMLPVRDIVIFPYMIIPLFIGRESSIRAVENSLAKNRLIFLSSQMDLNEENPSSKGIYKTGTIAMIVRMRKLADGRVKILIQGLTKARLTHYHQTQPFFKVRVEKIDEITNSQTPPEVEKLIRSVKEQLEKVISLGKILSPDILLVVDDIHDPGRVADLIASNLGLKVEDAQSILEVEDPLEKLKQVHKILSSELELLQMQVDIRSTVKDEMSKTPTGTFFKGTDKSH